MINEKNLENAYFSMFVRVCDAIYALEDIRDSLIVAMKEAEDSYISGEESTCG